MRVMDFYRCDDETIIENWIPIDVPHLLLQMGVDVFGRMRHQFRQHAARSAQAIGWLRIHHRGAQSTDGVYATSCPSSYPPGPNAVRVDPRYRGRLYATMNSSKY